MILPEPVTIDGREGVIVFLDEDGRPVAPSSERAVVAKAVFNDGSRSVYQVHPEPKHLGGAGSGNFGHAGRPGEVGGSAPAMTYNIWDPKGTKTPSVDTAAAAATHYDAALGRGGAESLARIAGAIGGKRAEGRATVTVGSSDVGASVYVPGVASVEYRVKANPEGPGRQVHLEEMTVEKRQQGHGVAKAFLRTALHEFEQMGVTEITLHANRDVGGYAWAKFGFEDVNPSATAQQLRASTSAVVKDTATAARIHGLLSRERNNPKLPQIVAGLHDGTRHVGKEILMHKSVEGWHGRLNLKDKAAVAKLKRYLDS